MGTGLPSLESRMSAQERLVTLLHARFEELSQEMTDNIRHITDSQFATEWKIDTHFDTVEAHVEEIWQDMDASFQKLADSQTKTERKIDTRFDQVDARLDNIEANMATKADLAGMATKADLANMESRILDAVKQLIDSRLPPLQVSK